MPIYVFVMQARCLQCMLGPRACPLSHCTHIFSLLNRKSNNASLGITLIFGNQLVDLQDRKRAEKCQAIVCNVL